jgi:CBS-domain-containing membrane protein
MGALHLHLLLMNPNLKPAVIAFLVLQIAVVLVIILDVPLILASWASSAALIGGLRASPAARPWAIGIAHVTAGAVGLGALFLLQAGLPFGGQWLIAPAVGFAVFGMMSFKALHPPAAANALIPLITAPLPISFAAAILFGAAVLATLAAVIDRFEASQAKGV